MTRKADSTQTPEDLSCPRCGIGRMGVRLVKYVEALDDTLLTAPKFLARECDVCHYREYDEDLLEQLEALVSAQKIPPARTPATAPRMSSRVKPRRTPDDPAAPLAPRKPKTPR